MSWDQLVLQPTGAQRPRGAPVAGREISRKQAGKRWRKETCKKLTFHADPRRLLWEGLRLARTNTKEERRKNKDSGGPTQTPGAA